MRLGSFDDCPATLEQALARAGHLFPDSGITLLDNRGRRESHRSFAELDSATKAGAQRWASLGVAAGAPILICLPTSWDFVDTWFGAARAGALPVAFAPPGALGSPAAQVAKALRICERINAAWLVAPQSFIDAAQLALAQPSPTGSKTQEVTQLISVDAFAKLTGESACAAQADTSDTAFLQLTSGSTGLPRAVEISHQALIHNALAIADGTTRLDGKPAEHIVSWLPLYHDMGLIGCLCHSLITGTSMDLLSPRSFLARPWIWFEAIERHQRAFAPAPNFAYQLCVERVSAERVASMNLSADHHIFSGSEMVRPDTVEAFLERFQPSGLEPARFRPCFGLAEATLAVTLDSRGQAARTHTAPGAEAATVALGEPLTDTVVEIWPQDSARPTEPLTGEIGRVMVRSPSLMSGYYQDPEATASVFSEGWLDTGDLGFLHDRELYLTGRSKEILILNGTNVMPHEIEWVAEAASAAGGSERCGAFSVLTETGEEPILVLETIEKDASAVSEIKREVGSAVGRALSIPLKDLVMVRRGSIPRTSSGKVQRRTLKSLYAAGELERIDDPTCSTD